jgi:hypothetical protein
VKPCFLGGGNPLRPRRRRNRRVKRWLLLHRRRLEWRWLSRSVIRRVAILRIRILGISALWVSVLRIRWRSGGRWLLWLTHQIVPDLAVQLRNLIDCILVDSVIPEIGLLLGGQFKHLAGGVHPI